MEYIRVKNNIIVDLVSCSEKPSEEWKEVSLEGGLHVGDDIRMFDSNWNFRNIEDLVKEGVVKLATADENHIAKKGTVLEKIVNNKIVPKTEYDLVKEGSVELGQLQYIDEINKTVKIASSLEEILDLGKIEKELYAEYKAVNLRTDRLGKLKKIDSVVSNPFRWDALTEDQKKELSDYRQALLDITDQKDFPFSVKWPKKPDWHVET